MQSIQEREHIKSETKIAEKIVEKMFSKCKYRPNIHLQSVELQSRKKRAIREKIRKKGITAEVTRSTIGALIGALVISIPSFGVAAGAGLVTGTAAIDRRRGFPIAATGRSNDPRKSIQGMSYTYIQQ